MQKLGMTVLRRMQIELKVKILFLQIILKVPEDLELKRQSLLVLRIELKFFVGVKT
jgi:hypothetical protein